MITCIMFWIKPHAIFGQVFREAWWRIPSSDGSVFITFDDGPHPETTPFILDCLKKSGMHATFFCLGRSVEKYPLLFKRILDEGHRTGLHTYSHLNGWTADRSEYLEDFARAAALIDSDLFRPPYGKLSLSLWKELKGRCRIVMWTISPEDYRADLSAETIFSRLTAHAAQGDIIVLHENDKSKDHIKQILPPYLHWLKQNGFTSKSLPRAN